MKDFTKFKGTHAKLNASNSSWRRYKTEEQFYNKYVADYAQDLGTAVHNLSEDLINFKIKVNKNDKHLLMYAIAKAGIPKNAYDLDFIFPTFAMYVNDAIGYRMTAEKVIGYSEVAYGTSDAISLKDGLLRIHDLKTGHSPAHMDQLITYAAFYCLNNDIKPESIKFELTLYQAGDKLTYIPTSEEVAEAMQETVNGSDIMMRFLEEGRY